MISVLCCKQRWGLGSAPAGTQLCPLHGERESCLAAHSPRGSLHTHSTSFLLHSALSRAVESTPASGTSPGAIHPFWGAQTLLAGGRSHQTHARLQIPGERRAGGSAPRCDGEGREGSESNQLQFRSGRESGSTSSVATGAEAQQHPGGASGLSSHAEKQSINPSTKRPGLNKLQGAA